VLSIVNTLSDFVKQDWVVAPSSDADKPNPREIFLLGEKASASIVFKLQQLLPKPMLEPRVVNAAETFQLFKGYEFVRLRHNQDFQTL
jgi:hypothetical protein